MIDSAFVTLLFILYPGVIGTSIFRLLVVHRPMSQFDFAPMALIFSVISFVADVFIGHLFQFDVQLWPTGIQANLSQSLEKYILSANFWVISFFGFAQGLGSAILMNRGILYDWLNKERKFWFLKNKYALTRKTGFVDVWQDFFLAHQGKNIELVTKTGRIFQGYVQHISDVPASPDSDLPGARELYLSQCREVQYPDNGDPIIIDLGHVYFTGDEIGFIIALESEILPKE